MTRAQKCPVCGFRGNPNDWLPDLQRMCKRCCVQFGLDDTYYTHASLRRLWKKAGKPYGDPEYLEDLEHS